MALLERIRAVFAPKDEERGLIWPGYPGPPSSFTLNSNPSGQNVTLDSALKSAAVWACQRLLVQTICQMRIKTVRDSANGVPKQVADPPIVSKPSARLRRRPWVGQVVRSMVQAGNLYGKVTVDGDLRPFNVETIHPSDVTWQQHEGEWTPFVGGQAQTIYPRGDFLHVPASQLMIPGQPFAMSPNDYFGVTVGMALAGQEFIARYFGDGAHATEIIKAPVNPTPAQAQAVKAALMNAWKGTREPAVLGKDWDYQTEAINFGETQVIELLRFCVEDTARFYGVPPAMVYVAISGQKITYQNVSQEDLQYLKHSVTAWMIDVEDAWSELLTLPGGTVDSRRVMFDTASLLRMDDMGRAQLNTVRLSNKQISVNQIMVDEGLDPWPDPTYDKPGLPTPPTTQPVAAPNADPHAVT